MSNLHTKLEKKVDELKQKIINVDNNTKALKNKLDSWRNEANNMITALKKEMKEEYAKLNDDFLELGKIVKGTLKPPKGIISLQEAIKNLNIFTKETEEEIEAFRKICDGEAWNDLTELVGITVTNPEYLEGFSTHKHENQSIKCDSCKNDIPPPINGCAKHKESGAKIGELVKCSSITGFSLHNDYYEPARKV